MSVRAAEFGLPEWMDQALELIRPLIYSADAWNTAAQSPDLAALDFDTAMRSASSDTEKTLLLVCLRLARRAYLTDIMGAPDELTQGGQVALLGAAPWHQQAILHVAIHAARKAARSMLVEHGKALPRSGNGRVNKARKKRELSAALRHPRPGESMQALCARLGISRAHAYRILAEPDDS